MAKRRSTRKQAKRSKTAPAKRAKPKPRAVGAEALAKEVVAAWRRGETPSLDPLVAEAKRMSPRARQALYRAVNRLVRARSRRNDSELAALVVRAIELETLVEVAAGDGSALAAFIGE